MLSVCVREVEGQDKGLSGLLPTDVTLFVVLLFARPESYSKDADLANTVPEGKQDQEEGLMGMY